MKNLDSKKIFSNKDKVEDFVDYFKQVYNNDI